MRRAMLGALTGAGVGFFAGFVIVQIFLHIVERETTPDSTGMVLILGVFLAGAGAIAGAIVGGVTDLKEFFQKKQQTPGEPRA